MGVEQEMAVPGGGRREGCHLTGRQHVLDRVSFLQRKS
jgi:hypothetical protein